jgi:hypothetical protein
MAYLGIWGPEGFEQAAPEGEGRQLFLEDGNPDFGQNFVTFECLHCSFRSATFDID